MGRRGPGHHTMMRFMSAGVTPLFYSVPPANPDTHPVFSRNVARLVSPATELAGAVHTAAAPL
jgi:hypothetical protein